VKGAAIFLLGFFIFQIDGIAQQRSNLFANQNYHPHTLIVKLKESPVNLRSAGSPIQKIQSELNIREIQPVINPSSRARTAPTQTGIERIFRIELNESENLFESIKKLQQLEIVEYAEPLYQNELLDIPNDPEANPSSGRQYHLTNIEAYDAWTVEKGDTSVVIGIVDTGVDVDHADLLPNIAVNHDDPENGVDDDHDGYVDNYLGWDIADKDGDPNTDGNGHGNIVTGISSAKTNNGIGLSGVGFQSRFMPIKVLENESGKLKNEYLGMLYAAEQGCQVINLSWGGAWSYSAFAQDMVNYVVLEKDAVVIAAAGNTSEEIDFYPASFDNVLSVSATDGSDNFTTWATYSYHVDLVAPGHSVFSANKNGGYGNGGNGTSYSAPMVAGAAALVRSKYPNLDARQVMQQLRVTADDISDIGSNDEYFGRIGRGRLNVAKALTQTNIPSLRISELNYSGTFGKHIFPGDTIFINPTIVNYLTAANSLNVTFSAADENTSSQPLSLERGRLDTYEYAGLEEGWQIVIDENLEPYTRLLFRTDFQANNYSDVEFFQLRTTPWFFDVVVNDLSLTVASDGDLGYDRDSLQWGSGFWSGSNKLADQLGIIISSHDDYLVNNVVNDYDKSTRDHDFQTDEYTRLYNNSTASMDARSSFSEAEIPSKRGLKVEQKILGWDEDPENNFVILEYRLTNTTDSILHDLNFSLFADWDIQNRNTNRLVYNPQTGVSYAFDPNESNLFTGLTLLTEGDTSFYAIDKSDANGHSTDFINLFTDSLKGAYSQSDFVKITAGNLSGGNDVAAVHGLRNIDLNVGESKKIAFVMMAGGNIEMLSDLLDEARNLYQNYLSHPPFTTTFYACPGDLATIQFEDNNSFEIYADPEITQLLDSGQVFKTPTLWSDTLFYTVLIEGGIRQDVRSCKVKIRDPKADFETYTDTLLISSESLDTITFVNTSNDVFYSNWSFGNGIFSTVKSPTVQYSDEGVYAVRLVIENDIGCRDTVVKSLVVEERIFKPIIEGQLICKGQSIILEASNTDSINVYDSKSLDDLLFSGSSFQSQTLSETTSFWVTNVEGPESLPVETMIQVSHPQLNFSYELDTLDLTAKYLLKIESQADFAENLIWNIAGDEFTDEIVIFDYTGLNEFEIQLIGEDSIGCVDKISEMIIPQPGIAPILEDQIICINESVQISPMEGGIFYFYSDTELTDLIHKGTTFSSGPIRSDTSFYVTNVDHFLDGTPVTVAVELKPLRAIIRLTPEEINLATDSLLLIEDISEGSTFSYWLFPTGGIDGRKNFELEITEPGDYDFTLIAESGENCIDTARATVAAFFVTGGEEKLSSVLVYPNPVQNVLYIQSGDFYYNKIELLDYTSKKVLKSFDRKEFSAYLEINISDLSNGIYLLRLQGKEQSLISKIIVRH